MNFRLFGKEDGATLLLIPGLGVSCEVFLPLIGRLEGQFRIVAVEVDGFVLGTYTRFTSIDDQARQVGEYVKAHLGGRLDCAYGLSLGGKILSRIMERGDIVIDHAILDAAPLLPLPRWTVGPLRYLQAFNVWTCYRWPGFWKRVFPTHYFAVLLDECKKIYPFGGADAVLDGYRSVYTNKLHSITGADIHYWYGTLEAFVAKPQVKHLRTLFSEVHVEVFLKLNHGQLLIDHPDEVARRIAELVPIVADASEKMQ